MDVSGSQWSSGCESGWTLYLDESYVFPRDNSNNVSFQNQHQSCRVNSVSCEEDLSMVSDASSGPPVHYQEEEDEESYGQSHHHRLPASEKKGKRSSKKEKKQLSKQYQYQHQHQHLDDTASSPAKSYAKVYDNPSANRASYIGFSQNLSETHFQGNTAVSTHYGFWQSPHPDNADSAEPSKLRGRRWG